jgi:WhiB family redox-sensing transcriptional regulator
MHLNVHHIAPRADLEKLQLINDYGACRDKSNRIFYLDKGDESRLGGQAKKICAECAVREECAEWGLSYELHGIWGGMTPKERGRRRVLENINRHDPLTVKFV